MTVAVLFALLLTALSTPFQQFSDVEHIVVYAESGRYAGWPANNGIWSWGDEILVGFDDGHFFVSERNKQGRGHAINYDLPVRSAQARSLDGGETWKVEWPNGIQPPPGRKIFGIPTGDIGNELSDLKQAIPFQNSDLALAFRTSYTEDDLDIQSYFYWSINRGKSWQGPFNFPNLGYGVIQARSDYIIEGSSSALVILPAWTTDRENKTIAVRTEDGGLTWALVSEFEGGDEPSTVRLSDLDLLSTTRKVVRTDSIRYTIIDSYRSLDNGESWSRVGPIVQTTNFPDLLKLNDGRLVLTYGYRQPPTGIRAKISSDNGETWGKEIILRDDGGNYDLGYSQSVQRKDGKIVTVYYFNDDPDKERFIGATIWTPLAASNE